MYSRQLPFLLRKIIDKGPGFAQSVSGRPDHRISIKCSLFSVWLLLVKIELLVNILCIFWFIVSFYIMYAGE